MNKNDTTLEKPVSTMHHIAKLDEHLTLLTVVSGKLAPRVL